MALTKRARCDTPIRRRRWDALGVLSCAVIPIALACATPGVMRVGETSIARQDQAPAAGSQFAIASSSVETSSSELDRPSRRPVPSSPWALAGVNSSDTRPNRSPLHQIISRPQRVITARLLRGYDAAAPPLSSLR